MGDKSGQLESELLAVDALGHAVERAVGQMKKLLTENTKTIVFYTDGSFPGFDHLMSFRAQKNIAEDALLKAVEVAEEAEKKAKDEAYEEPKEHEPDRTIIAASGVIAAPAAVGAVLDTFDKLAGFFRTEYTMQGVNINLPDAALIKEFVRKMKLEHPTVKLFVPLFYAPTDIGESSIRDEINSGVEQYKKASLQAKAFRDRISIPKKTAETLGKEIKDTKKLIDSEKDPARREELKLKLSDLREKKKSMDSIIDTYQKIINSLETAMEFFNKFFDRLVSKSKDSGEIPLAAVLNEEALRKRLDDPSTYLLFSKIDIKGGGYFTKKNILTFFGKMPLWHMGGISVSYLLMEGKTGEAVAGGSVPIHGGFVRTKELVEMF